MKGESWRASDRSWSDEKKRKTNEDDPATLHTPQFVVPVNEKDFETYMTKKKRVPIFGWDSSNGKVDIDNLTEIGKLMDTLSWHSKTSEPTYSAWSEKNKTKITCSQKIIVQKQVEIIEHFSAEPAPDEPDKCSVTRTVEICGLYPGELNPTAREKLEDLVQEDNEQLTQTITRQYTADIAPWNKRAATTTWDKRSQEEPVRRDEATAAQGIQEELQYPRVGERGDQRTGDVRGTRRGRNDWPYNSGSHWQNRPKWNDVDNQSRSQTREGTPTNPNWSDNHGWWQHKQKGDDAEWNHRESESRGSDCDRSRGKSTAISPDEITEEELIKYASQWGVVYPEPVWMSKKSRTPNEAWLNALQKIFVEYYKHGMHQEQLAGVWPANVAPPGFHPDRYEARAVILNPEKYYWLYGAAQGHVIRRDTE